MNSFAALLDRLSHEGQDEARARLIAHYLRHTPDPERGLGLALLSGRMLLPRLSPARLRKLATGRVDPVLLQLSQAHVGDLAETLALVWPQPLPGVQAHGLADHARPPLFLEDLCETLAASPQPPEPEQLASWLDRLDDLGRWALLKLLTGKLLPLRPARLIRIALAQIGSVAPAEVDALWPLQSPPYVAFLAFLEGRGPRPMEEGAAPFRPLMPLVSMPEEALHSISPHTHLAEWTWDGLRMELVCATGPDGSLMTRLYDADGEDITLQFPEIAMPLPHPAVLDGVLIVLKDGRGQPRAGWAGASRSSKPSPRGKAQTSKGLCWQFRAFDLLADTSEDLRDVPLATRRKRLEALLALPDVPRTITLSPALSFADADELSALLREPSAAGADELTVKGLVLKSRAAPYLLATSDWWNFTRPAHHITAVLLYVQRSSNQDPSRMEATFGLWRDGMQGPELVPVGRAIVDLPQDEAELLEAFIRTATINRFGPVREVLHDAENGLVLDVAYGAVTRSSRHKCGLVLSDACILGTRPGMRPDAADRLSTLQDRLQDALQDPLHAALPPA